MTPEQVAHRVHNWIQDWHIARTKNRTHAPPLDPDEFAKFVRGFVLVEMETAIRTAELDCRAKLAEAQQREAWWRGLYALIELPVAPNAEEREQYLEYRRLLGLDAAEEKK